MLAVAVWPLLFVKWVVVTRTSETGHRGGDECGMLQIAEARRDRSELGYVVMLTCALLIAAALYFTFVDRRLSPRASVRKAVDRACGGSSSGGGAAASLAGDMRGPHGEGHETTTAPSPVVCAAEASVSVSMGLARVHAGGRKAASFAGAPSGRAPESEAMGRGLWVEIESTADPSAAAVRESRSIGYSSGGSPVPREAESSTELSRRSQSLTCTNWL